MARITFKSYHECLRIGILPATYFDNKIKGYNASSFVDIRALNIYVDPTFFHSECYDMLLNSWETQSNIFLDFLKKIK